jgi:hypothetical protein
MGGFDENCLPNYYLMMDFIGDGLVLWDFENY